MKAMRTTQAMLTEETRSRERSGNAGPVVKLTVRAGVRFRQSFPETNTGVPAYTCRRSTYSCSYADANMVRHLPLVVGCSAVTLARILGNSLAAQ